MAKITEEDFETFLGLVQSGVSRYQAARSVGTTATRMKWALKREPCWRERYESAMLPRRQLAELRRLLGVP